MMWAGGSGDGGWDGGAAKEQGKWGRIAGRVLDDPSNPLGWSVTVGAFRGIRVGVHLVTVVFMVAMLLSSLPRGNFGIGFTAIGMGSLFVVVLLHEFGHCFAARWSGGEADRIVMLPFGGLALTRPEHNWWAHFVTTAGGPGVNVLLFPVTAIGLALLGHASTIVFNPFDPGGVLSTISAAGSDARYWLIAGVWIFHYTNLLILAFNLVMVFYPFDGGRLVQAIAWRKLGFVKSMGLAVNVGLVGAALVFIFAVVVGETMLVAIAAFGGIACWVERSRLKSMDEITGMAMDGGAFGGLGVDGGSGSSGGGGDWGIEEPGGVAEKIDRKALKAAQQAEEDEAALDRILEKIGKEGKESLSRAERKVLERMTKKKQSE